MIRRRKPLLQRLVSGLYVPLLLHFADPYPCAGCCAECPCSACDGLNPPCCFKIVITGIVEGTCGECDCLNDTFYVPRLSTCTWRQYIDPYLCDANPVQVTVYLDGSDYKLKTELGGNVWIKNYGATKPTCEDLIDESIPYSASGSDCDASSSTCLVTAVAEADEVNCPSIPFECAQCRCNLLPKGGFQVVLSGIQNEPICGECTAFDGTYILSGSNCFHRYTFDPLVCLSDTLDLTVGAGNLSVFVIGEAPGGGAVTYLSFRKIFDPADVPIDCRNLVDVLLPSRGLENCDQSAATCLVTSLA